MTLKPPQKTAAHDPGESRTLADDPDVTPCTRSAIQNKATTTRSEKGTFGSDIAPVM